MDNLRGAILMVLAMLAFAIEDMFIKLLAGAVPIGQIIAVLGAGGATVFALILIWQGKPLFVRDMLTWPIAVRLLGEVIGTLGFVTAIALTPISTASAILQATPLVVTLGAALFLGESVGWRRWTAIFVGFVGVLLIIRPGLEGFDWRSVFALQGVLGLAMRDLATRWVPPETSSVHLSFIAFLVLVPTGVALMIGVQSEIILPDLTQTILLAASVLIGVIAYYLIVAAMRLGDVGFVTPFRYSRILFALIIGWFVFAERPDAMTFIGAAVIVGSGIYTLWRERQVRAAAT